VHCVSAEVSRNLYTPLLPATRGFKMASLNITSLLKHLDELKILLNDNPIDVLAINETRLDSSITDCEVFIPGVMVDMAEEFVFMYELVLTVLPS
jgi:hypothetical protein